MRKDTERLNAQLVAEPFPAVPARSGRTARERLALVVAAHLDWFVAGILGALALLTYLWTLAPTVLGADSGRFQARAYVLGIGHPTGYPTFIMFGKLFTFLPFNDVAYRVNLSSAVYATAAVVLLYLLARRVAGRFPAFVAAAAFAVSRTFWSQAVIAEVYTLHALFLCATLLVLLIWGDTRKDRYLLGAAFLTGLSLTNHMTSGLLIPASVLLVWLTDRTRLRDWRLLTRAALLFLLGLTPYLYLPIRASMDPPLNYADPSTIGNFLDLVLGRQFADKMWAFGPDQLPRREAMYWMDLRKQFNILLLVLALVGATRQYQRDRRLFATLALLLAGNLFYALEYNIEDIFVYFMPTHLVLAIWMAVGTEALLERMRAAGAGSLRAVTRTVVLAALLLILGVSWWNTYAAVDQSDNYAGRELMERIIRIPEHGVLYDRVAVGVIGYLKYVEGRRLDLEVREVKDASLKGLVEQDLSAGRHVYFLDKGLRPTLGREYVFLREEGLWRAIRNTPEDFLLTMPEFTTAVDWLKSNGLPGAVITNPGADKALAGLGIPSVLRAATPDQLQNRGNLPKNEREQALASQWVHQVAGSERTRDLLDKYGVRYIFLMKHLPPGYPLGAQAKVRWTKYGEKPERYTIVYQNAKVVIYRVNGA